MSKEALMYNASHRQFFFSVALTTMLALPLVAGAALAGDHRASDLNPQATSRHRSGEMTKTVIIPAHDDAPVMVRKNFTSRKTKMCDPTPTNKSPCFDSGGV
jgi:hypothetical protein